MMDIFEFDCNGRNRPAYSCNKPGDNSGVYVRFKDACRVVEKIRKLALREHYSCDDCFYSCPKSEEGCCNDELEDECNCGADEHNKEVNEIYEAFINDKPTCP